ncbi:MAG TPA: hypothetical protein VMH33_09325 [Solirubrobacterales bacterium]|nr:hypothetical protein [Solirubrobacterales bacterium]
MTSPSGHRIVLFVLLAALSLLPAVLLPAVAQAFEISSFGVAVTTEGGVPATLAGSHPVALNMEVGFAPEGGGPFTEGDVRDLDLELPPGLFEDPAAMPECSQADFSTPRSSPYEVSLSGESCPASTQVGTLTVASSYGGGETRTFGLFNLTPPPGAPSELGAAPYGSPILFVPVVRQAEGEYGITLQARRMPQLVDISSLTVTIWGTPWSILHNSRRGECLNEAEPAFGWAKCAASSGHPPYAYLTLPTNCESPLEFTAVADSWEAPGQTVSRPAAAPGMAAESCRELLFHPHAEAILTNLRSSSPSGFHFSLETDQAGLTDPAGRVPSPPRSAVVALAPGITINPSVGSGLGVCTPAQYAAETASSPPGAGCPNASKIGDFTVQSPLFSETVEGALFLAAPHENPFGSLLAVYLVAKDPERGILVKVAGHLEADPADGRLTARFDRLPQLPYTSLQINFREGQRSPLATPAGCGSYSTGIDLAPWRDPALVNHTDSRFTIAAGPEGSACPGAIVPFAPHASGGMVSAQAGAYSSFYLHLTRTDAEQEITSYSATLPPGLLGKIAGIPLCSDAAIAAASLRSGIEELEHPDCPAASRIGHTISGYGVGAVPTYAPGGLYLAGPYHGSDLSVVAIDSALVGPFDLGTVIVRSAIRVDPRSAQVQVDSAGSDPIPHILDGIPIHLRDIRVYIDRPETMLNPTSCERFSLASTLTGSAIDFGDFGGMTATASAPFQAFDCAGLGFRPALSLRLRGDASHGAYPALRVEVRPRAGDADVASAQVALPPSLFLAQRHIRKVCTVPEFEREACPAGSLYGHARAFTPLLSQPLEGGVYLRASQHKLPDLVVALRGGGIGIKVDLVGRIDSYKGGLRGSFSGLPDAPVSRFVMTLWGGKRGLLQSAARRCAFGAAQARLVGHAARGVLWRPPVSAVCRKPRRHRHDRHQDRRHR